jgi:hypothetical protein
LVLDTIRSSLNIQYNMALAQINEQQQQQLLESPLFRQEIEWKIFNRAAYLKGINSGDVTWAKNRTIAAAIVKSPQIVMSDFNLVMTFLIHLKMRGFLIWDDENTGFDIAPIIAHMEAENHFEYLLDDYFTKKAEESVVF